MYAAYFGLTERPFSLAPDPRYLYLSDAHREALAHLLYGIGEGGSFVQLTGEVGTGKTTVCRALLEQLPPDVDVAMIFNPRLTSVELLAQLDAPDPPTVDAAAYLRERLLEREGGRFGRAIDVTRQVAAIPVPGDRLVAYPSRPPSLTIAEPGDEPLPHLDAGAAAVARGAAPGVVVTALETLERTRPLGKLLGRAQVGRDVVTLMQPPDEVGPAPGERAGDAVLCEPVELRWTMGGVRHDPLAVAVHLVVVRGGRVLADRLAAADRCR